MQQINLYPIIQKVLDHTLADTRNCIQNLPISLISQGKLITENLDLAILVLY